MSIVYINSTLPERRRMSRDGSVTPLHYWGYVPATGDAVLAHRVNRFEIHARARLRGVDLSVFCRTLWQLARGADGVYAVTQPDIRGLLPLIRRLFPSKRLVTWAWNSEEAERHWRQLKVCDLVLCLTASAKRRLDELGMADRSSLQIWGADPEFFRRPAPSVATFDVLLAGLTGRDGNLVEQAIRLNEFTVAALPAARRRITLPAAPLTVLPADSAEHLITAYYRSRVTWIPLNLGDPFPSGYTNLIESLLSGTPVVIAQSSTIPEAVLSLPGVFRYATGHLAEFRDRTRTAITFSMRSGNRDLIRATAARVLNGEGLTTIIKRTLQGELRPELASSCVT